MFLTSEVPTWTLITFLNYNLYILPFLYTSKILIFFTITCLLFAIVVIVKDNWYCWKASFNSIKHNCHLESDRNEQPNILNE